MNESGRAGYTGLMESGLYDELAAKRLLVTHVEVDAPRGCTGGWRVLKPDPVPFISHPCEWSFGQLRAAALTTLRIQNIALSHGMSLRDASAFNVQFIGSQPLFIDTLSFESCVEGRPWVGYRQFCQHFLAPLFLMAGCDPRLSVLSSSWIDGIPLDVASRLVPRRYRWNPGFLTHIALHARAQARYQEASARPTPPARLSPPGLASILEHLRSTIEKLSWDPAGTQWADYYSKTNYSDEAMRAKRSFVESVVGELKPRQVVDLGANTGEFAAIAARGGAYVVAADVDHGAVELCFRKVSEAGDRSILPLVVDLASPTPAVGWMNEERSSFLGRCSGETDLALALALLHHLVIGNNVPLRSVAALLARTSAHAVVEFVDKRDSQVQRLLSSRQDIFDEYSQSGFESAFSGLFRIIRRQPIPGAHRLLYHLARVSPGSASGSTRLPSPASSRHPS